MLLGALRGYLHFVENCQTEPLIMGRDDKETNAERAASLADRISEFENRKSKLQERKAKAQMPAEGMALAGRVATELVAGLVVGGALGWALDSVFDTSPFWLIVLFFLGAIGGMMNVWRLATGRGMAAGYFDEREDEPKDASPDNDQS